MRTLFQDLFFLSAGDCKKHFRSKSPFTGAKKKHLHFSKAESVNCVSIHVTDMCKVRIDSQETQNEKKQQNEKCRGCG